MKTYYICRIDTDEYSGNFEREMGAFLTGVADEYGGESEAAEAQEDLSAKDFEWFEENISLVQDEEHEYDRPAIIAPTPGWSNNGHGKHFHNEKHPYPAYQSVQIQFQIEPPAHIKTILCERAKKFASKNKLKVSNVEFSKVETSVKITIL
jgi:hypothetical protein